MTQSDGMIVTKKAKAEGHLSTRPHSSLATLTSLSEWGLNVSTCRISILLEIAHPYLAKTSMAVGVHSILNCNMPMNS
ncbi:hypothetical protein [Ochrobactrum teleogrylli]|uniref:Transposase n=1 Tax=Ochrobactrum teleogrylli TaxID=2479765 RepID=A0ABD5JWQ2_9HYPH